MLFLYWLDILLLCLFAAAEHLVALNLDRTIENFLQYDTTYPKPQRVKQFIQKSFKIGNFTVMVGNFTTNALTRLRRCPFVGDITTDVVFTAYDTEVQENCPRHLARLSSYKMLKGEDLSYIYNGHETGYGVNAYVIDSGVDVDHPEFEGRAVHGADFTGDGPGDSNGHGSHVAGIIGSRTYGVSKDVQIIDIKALNSAGVGALSTILSALEFAVDHQQKAGVPGVVNLSLGAPKNKVVNQAIAAAVDTGVVVVSAAGNSNVDACKSSPASAAAALTVGSIDDRTDNIASFSNWGKCVDVFASGSRVASVKAYDTKTPQLLTGTSMSTPIVTGLVSNLLSGGVSAAKAKEMVVSMSARGRIPKVSVLLRRGTPNRIAYNGVEYDSDEE